MDFLISNWVFLLVGLAVLIVVAYNIYVFIKRPTNEQLSKLKEWLLYGVAEAEKQLGGGTGQIKLRYVYDMFLSRFPYLAKVIPFDLFSNLVDEVLEKFRNILESNENVKDYINK